MIYFIILIFLGVVGVAMFYGNRRLIRYYRQEEERLEKEMKRAEETVAKAKKERENRQRQDREQQKRYNEERAREKALAKKKEPQVNQKLTKLLALTQSPNDNEALLAMRKANEIIQAENKSWEQILNTPKPKDLGGDPLFNALYNMIDYCIRYLRPGHHLTTLQTIRAKLGENGVQMDDIKFVHNTYAEVRKSVSAA